MRPLGNGQQDRGLQGTDELQRIEVVPAPAHTPVQAGGHPAVVAPAQHAQHLPAADPVPAHES